MNSVIFLVRSVASSINLTSVSVFGSCRGVENSISRRSTKQTRSLRLSLFPQSFVLFIASAENSIFAHEGQFQSQAEESFSFILPSHSIASLRQDSTDMTWQLGPYNQSLI